MADQLYKKGTILPFCVSADHQTHGRGRQGRTWHSLEGNVHISYVFEISSYVPLSYLPILFSSEILKPLLSLSSHDSHALFSLKWPNDLLLNGKKVGGMLMHKLDESPTENILSLGLGINVVRRPTFEEKQLSFSPTSLQEEGYAFSHKEIIHMITTHLEALLKNMPFECHLQEYWEKVRQSWLDYCHHKNKIIQIRNPQSPHEFLTGRFITIDQNGHLVLEVETDGEEHEEYDRKSFATGDVFF